jgi:hypothetical protein
MKRIMLTVLLVIVGASAQAADRRYTVTDFDRIRVEGPFIVTVTTGKPPSAVASGSSQALDRVSIDVEGRTLKISPNRSAWGGYPGERNGPVEVKVTGHELRAASVNGSGRLAIDHVEAMRFDVGVAGSGELAVDRIEADRLFVSLLGSGSIALGGKAESLTGALSGSGSLDARGLTAEQAELTADTAGTIVLTVSETAEVKATGAGDTTIHGSPSCEVSVHGIGGVACGD